MKVNNTTTKNLANISSDTVRDTKTKGLSKGFDSKIISPEAAVDSAKVEFSQRSKDMKKIKELALAAPDVNEEKVAKFRSLIDSGNYKVDARKIADKLVDDQLLNVSADDE